MVVISLINGSIISETAAIYALKYAKKLEYKYILAHIQGSDALEDVQKSVQNITKLSTNNGVESEFISFETLDEFIKFVAIKDIDMLFCSTRHKHTLFDKSFVKSLLKKNIKADLAVLKVVKIGVAQSVDKIILPIRDSKLSVRKFALFASFSLIYDAKSEIYSVDKVRNRNLAKIDLTVQKKKLKEIVFNLRHYLKLSKLMDFKFSIKHDYALQESDVVLSHIAKNEYDLAIVGGHHDKSFFGGHPIDILFEKPIINTLYFIPHKDEI